MYFFIPVRNFAPYIYIEIKACERLKMTHLTKKAGDNYYTFATIAVHNNCTVDFTRFTWWPSFISLLLATSKITGIFLQSAQGTTIDIIKMALTIDILFVLIPNGSLKIKWIWYHCLSESCINLQCWKLTNFDHR